MYHGKSKTFNPFSWLVVGDVLVIVLSFAIPVYVIREKNWSDPLPSRLECIFYAAIILFYCRRMKLYSWGVFTRFERLLGRLAITLFLSGFSFVALRFVFLENSQIGFGPLAHQVGHKAVLWLDVNSPDSHGIRNWLWMQLLAAFVLFLLFRRLAFRFSCRAVPRLAIERLAFVEWSTKLSVVVTAMVRERMPFLELMGFFYKGREAGIMGAMHGHHALGDLEHLEENIQRKGITLLLVDQTNISAAEMRQIAEVTARNFTSLEIIHSSFDIWATYLGIRVVGGVPVVGIVNQMRHERLIDRVLKRTMDIGCALFGLVLSAPIIAVCGVLIYLESPGPVFYRQPRLTLGGREFQIIKLRSMRLDADNVSGVGWTVKNDPRRLRIGKFMREWNLDELPQFWNVLKGDMSVVGPRPERTGSVDKFKHTIRYYNLRFTCKSGLTGWAAVHGLRGDTSITDRIEYDLYYIENWSLWLDIKILFMTLVPPENAY